MLHPSKIYILVRREYTPENEPVTSLSHYRTAAGLRLATNSKRSPQAC